MNVFRAGRYCVFCTYLYFYIVFGWCGAKLQYANVPYLNTKKITCFASLVLNYLHLEGEEKIVTYVWSVRHTVDRVAGTGDTELPQHSHSAELPLLHTISRMSDLGKKWVRLTPNEKNPVLFQIKFHILARRAKM